jgi:streptomycin 6-kinase
VRIEETKQTDSALIAFGTQDDRPVAVKVLRRIGDEWQSGAVLDAWNGAASVRVFAHEDGALLMERLRPGFPLTDLVTSGRDHEATAILADVIARMPLAPSPPHTPAVEDWAEGFRRHRATRDPQIPAPLVQKAEALYRELCASQRERRLLHGDLHHDNVLWDSSRGWTAIDPKGVIGELEYEIGASLRNPIDRPELFASAQIVQRRLGIYEERLKLDVRRATSWCFSQAVLSAIWSVEDGFAVSSNSPVLLLANSLSEKI